ncbi:MAG: diacylglycerol kinase [Mahellales bacterium]
MKVRKLMDSFEYAISGLIYCLKSQINMKIHVFIAVVVLLLSIMVDLTRTELIALYITITMVLVAEMINTSVETVVDMISKQYHPKAEIAKNVAAGAVLLTAVNAVVVGYLLFFDRLSDMNYIFFTKLKNSPIHLSFLAIVVSLVLVIFLKFKIGKGGWLRGGMPSGHSALAFSIVTAIFFVSGNVLVFTLGFVLGLLVIQSRIESGIHSVYEVVMGGIIGIVITFLIFKLFLW